MLVTATRVSGRVGGLAFVIPARTGHGDLFKGNVACPTTGEPGGGELT